MTAQFLFFFDVCPLRTPVLLVTLHPATKFLVPYLCRSYIHRRCRPLMSQTFCITAFSGALASRNQYYLLHNLLLWFSASITINKKLSQGKCALRSRNDASVYLETVSCSKLYIKLYDSSALFGCFFCFYEISFSV